VAILGFDTSTAASTAAVLLPEGEAVENVPPPARLSGRPAHASELLPAIDDVMRRAGVGFAELEAIAVGVGPGTFTGLRIGVATARALAKANGLPLRGVSSLAALGAGMPAGSRLPLLDA
jgi:tRNA threonylcarbamoyladenosine biosynthesis protein TsaB